MHKFLSGEDAVASDQQIAHVTPVHADIGKSSVSARRSRCPERPIFEGIVDQRRIVTRHSIALSRGDPVIPRAVQGQKYSLVVSMSKVTNGFAGLLIEPDRAGLPAGEGAQAAVLEAVEGRTEALLAGAFAAERRAPSPRRARE
jgi:hypothetical protein